MMLDVSTQLPGLPDPALVKLVSFLNLKTSAITRLAYLGSQLRRGRADLTSPAELLRLRPPEPR